MKKIILAVSALFFISLITAGSVSFFYSPTCPHCQEVIPLINSYSNLFPNWEWNAYDITKGSYSVEAVPLVKINTDDNREINLLGTDEIENNLGCELQEMSTLNCPTLTASSCNAGSWFIN